MPISKLTKTALCMATSGVAALALNASVASAELSTVSSVSQVSPATQIAIKLGTKGQLADRGLTVYLPLTVTCQATADQGYVNVTLRERVGRDIATASGGVSVPCDGATHTVTVRADAFDVPFKRGKAIVDGYASVCGPSGCATATDRAEVALR